MKRQNAQVTERIEKLHKEGLSVAQTKLINALDKWFDENPQGPTLHEMMGVTGLSFGVIWNALPLLEHCGYVIVNRNRKGRIVNRGVILLYGFDYRKDL